MSDIQIIDKDKLEKILVESFKLSKNYKTVNSNVVEEIIVIMKEVLKDNED